MNWPNARGDVQYYETAHAAEISTRRADAPDRLSSLAPSQHCLGGLSPDEIFPAPARCLRYLSKRSHSLLPLLHHPPTQRWLRPIPAVCRLPSASCPCLLS